MAAPVERRHFEAFVAVAEELHFGRAAKRLHLSQPAVTQTIKSLESTLGVVLLDRTRRAVHLTAAGHDFLTQARDVLARMEDSVTSAQATAVGRRGELRVSYTGGMSLSPLPDLLADYRKQAPEIEIRLSQASTTAQIEALATDRLDVGYTFLNPTAPAGLGLRVHEFGRAPLVAVLPSNHRLAHVGPIAIEQLADEAYFTLSQAAEPGLRPLAAFVTMPDHRQSPRIALEVDQLDALLSLVARGVGVALLPSNVQQFSVAGVSYVELSQPLEMSMYLMWSDRSSNPALAEFIALLGFEPAR